MTQYSLLKRQVCVSLFFFLLVNGLFAQSIQLTSNAMRQLVTLNPGSREISLCGLKKGNVYTVGWSGIPQPAAVEWMPTNKADFSPAAPGYIRFTATAACMNLPVSVKSLGAVSAHLSVYTDQPKNQSRSAAGILKATPGNPQTLLKQLFSNSCYQISNITYNGQPTAIGSFSGGQTNIGLSEGLVLATGEVSVVEGPNSDPGKSAGFGLPAVDPDLQALAGGSSLFDEASLEFDVVPSGSTFDLRFLFGSEEYCEYVNSQFNDVFAILISGPGINGKKNIATVPGSTLPVSVNTVNHLTNTTYYINNTDDSNCSYLPAAAMGEVQLDGWTKSLIATASVIPCSTYHVKIAIADVGDGIWDSGVFITASSSSSQIIASLDLPALNATYEGCVPGYLRLKRTGSNINLPQVASFTVGGTATPGADYNPLVSPVIIPAGQMEVLVPIIALQDGLTEGAETVTINVQNGCSCNNTPLSFTINDVQPLSVELPDQSGCLKTGVLLSPIIKGGAKPYAYAWSNGEAEPEIKVYASGTYRVTVLDACGNIQTDVAQVTSKATVEASLVIEFCEGDSVTVFGNTYKQTQTFFQTISGKAGECDTLYTIKVQATNLFKRKVSLTLCPNELITIDGKQYAAPDTVISTKLGKMNSCDTLVTYFLLPAKSVQKSETILFCPGASVSLGGKVYTQPGTVVVYSGPGGCDTATTYTLSYYPLSNSTVKITCPSPQIKNIDQNAPLPVITYNLPTATTNCICPDITFEQTSGLASGSKFPTGVTTNCFKATDACGNTASCCFTITVIQGQPCVSKTSGCVKWELYPIQINGEGNRTYRLRVTNNCTQAMVSAAFQLPSGITAVTPANNATYTSPTGRQYVVNNPSFSNFYSIRFNPVQTGIANGASDFFEYTLPQQANPASIYTMIRLAPNFTYITTLSTTTCGFVPGQDRSGSPLLPAETLIYPNPAEDLLFISLPDEAERLQSLRILDLRGAVVLQQTTFDAQSPLAIELPKSMTNGLYMLEMTHSDGRVEALQLEVVR